LSRYQLVKNKMDVYLIGSRPLHQDPGNLFALRFDLQLGQFDQGRFVIVSKSGQLVVHFLQPANQSAQRYHNVQFDHKNSLSHELLYARFAWALMKIVKNASLGAKMFNFLRASGESTPEQHDIEGTDDGGGGSNEGGGGGGGGGNGGGGGGSGGGGQGGGGGGKRKRDENEEQDGHNTFTSGPSGNLRSSKHITSDACPREDGSQFLLDRETQEFEEDMKTAAHTLPFFVDPNREANARHYENIVWYPGKAGENKHTLTLIRRLGPTVVTFCLMIITRLMTRMGCNTLWVPSSSASSTQMIRVVPIAATTSTLHPLHMPRNLLSSIHFINTLRSACAL